MNFHFIKYKNLYFIFSGILILLSIFFLIHYGLNFGIDFTGGSLLKVEYKEAKPSNQDVIKTLSEFNLSPTSITSIGKNGLAIEFKSDVSQDEQNKIEQALNKKKKIFFDRTSFERISGLIGRETKQKAVKATFFSLIAIILYVAFAFRRISKPVSSFRYGLATVIALMHDVTIPLGVFSILGKFYGVPVTLPIITALLTVFGYSVNDTVVVFDRVRENLIKRVGVTFEETVDVSLNQTLFRSVSTSFTTLLVLFSIFFLGGETLRYFSLALIIGIISGTYSSIFLASPLLVYWANKKTKKKYT